MKKLNVTVVSFTAIAGLLLFFFQNCQIKKLGSAMELASVSDSEASSVVNEPPPAIPDYAPDMAGNLAGIGISQTEISLSWVLPPQQVTQVNIERSPDPAGPFVTIAVLNQSADSYSDTGLSASTTYHYRITLENAVGISPYSMIASVITTGYPPASDSSTPPSSGSNPTPSPSPDPVIVTPPSSSPDPANQPEPAQDSDSPATDNSDGSSGSISLPVAPSNLVAVAVSSTRIDLSWSDNSSDEYGFRVEQATSNAGPYKRISSVGDNSTARSVNFLAAGTTYYFRIYAFNRYGSSEFSNIVTATTPP